MTAKMKGLLKGLRYISQIFDEDKHLDMEIGFPTDVKHVAHIGWDEPSVDSPSWLNGFKEPVRFQSAPLAGTSSGEPQESPEVKWVSEDSKINSREAISSAIDNPDAPRVSRRRSAENSESSSRGKEASSSKKGSRRHSKQSSSENVKLSHRHIHERGGPAGDGTSETNSEGLPILDIPKKTRRKKSKEAFSGGGTGRSSRSKANNNNATSSTHNNNNNTSQFPDEAAAAAGANCGSTKGSRFKGANSSNKCTTFPSVTGPDPGTETETETVTGSEQGPEPEQGPETEDGPGGGSSVGSPLVTLPIRPEEDEGSSGVC